MSDISTQAFSKKEIHRLARLVNNRELELIILPTEKCNFRCTYCYEDFAIGKMKPETINAVKELIERRAKDLDNLYLSWFGGEPLLATDVILEISSYAAELTRDYPFYFRGSMTTNGYLLEPHTFSALAGVGVLDYQISLDGPREVHDRTRVKMGKGGTFDTIWNNLLRIRTTDFPFQIKLRVHFSADTVLAIDPLIEEIKRNFIPDPRFTVFFKSIGRWGGANDHNINLLTPEEEQAALERMEVMLYGEVSTPPEEGSEVCYASRPNSLVIRADGRIGKCTVALNDSRNVIGTLQSDGTLALHQRRVRPWLRGLETMDADILACPLVGLPSE